MSGKRKQDVRGLLLEGNFGVSRDLPASDPLTTAQMVLEIDRIKPYDRNPRREINPRYDDIKESIRAQGRLNNPLTITRRPGEESFMVEAGGNTRLMILQELWQETGDSRFQRIHCLFVPWRSESHVLGAHLIENELRGEMLLIDKALAVRELHKLLESESGIPINQSELQRQLTSLGYKISRRQLSRFLYAADILEPVIPKVLRAGLGRYHVDQLRALEGAYRRLFDSLAVSDPTYSAWFAATLSHLDREDLTLQTICDAMKQSFAKISGLPSKQVHNRIETLLNDGPKNADEDSADPDGVVTASISTVDVATNESPATPRGASPGSPSDFVGPHVQNDVASVSTRSKEMREVRPASEHGLPGSQTEGNSMNRLTVPDQSAKVATFKPTADCYVGQQIESPDHLPEQYDLNSWRKQACELAEQIAGALGFGEAIQPWIGGYGFTLDLPEQGFADDQAWAGWWLLLGISEQAVSADRSTLITKGHCLASHLSQHGEDALHTQRIGSPPAIFLLPFHLLQSRQLSDQVFDSLWRLIACCRAMRRHYRESDLWDCLTVEQSRLHAQLIGIGDHNDG